MTAATVGFSIAPMSPASAAPGMCSEKLRIGDRISVYHYGHYDTWAFVDAYNFNDPRDIHMHVFHDRTHKVTQHVKCSDVYRNHPGT
jgi:hypothetical protein